MSTIRQRLGSRLRRLLGVGSAKRAELPITELTQRKYSPKAGININAPSVYIGGNVIGGNAVTAMTNTGMSAADFAKIFEIINARARLVPPAIKEDVRDAVDTIKAEAKKEAVEGKPPDGKAVKLASQALVAMAPDILEAAAASLADPAAGVALIMRKVLDRAKAIGSGAA